MLRPAIVLVAATAAIVGSVSRPSPVAAQASSDALVLPVSVTGDAEWTQPTGARLRRVLASRGDSVWTVSSSADRFEERASAPAPKVTESDIEEWVERSRSAVRYLARGDYAAARRELVETQRLSEKAAEELNREASRARQVLDTCLYMVRALVETNRRAEARRRARDCRQLVPRVEPSPHRHTPEVQSILDRVDREAARAKQGSLVVKSTPSGCGVRLNGVSFGRTPFTLEDLTPGQYSVQVECDEQARGRVHRVTVKPGRNELAVDAHLDSVVRTRPELALVYDGDGAPETALDDASKVAATIGAKRVFVLTVPEEGVLRVDELKGDAHHAVWLRTSRQGPSRSALNEGLAALASGRSVDFTGDSPAERNPAAWHTTKRRRSAARSGGPGTPSDKPKKSHRVAGFTLVGVGAAAVATGFGLHVARAGRGDDFVADPGNLRAQSDWIDLRAPTLALGAIGGASLTAAMPLVLPYRDKTPWWAWATGAAGLGLAGFAVYQGVSATDEPSERCANSAALARACVDHEQEIDRAALLASLAAPMLTMPLVYLLRPKRVTLGLTAHRRGFAISVGKTF